MSIRIDGGVVVGWSGTSHEIIPNGSVLIDGNAIKSVGADRSQPADRVIDASGKIVCPGFRQSACSFPAQRRRLSPYRCHQERLSCRQLVRFRCAVEGKGRTTGAAGGGAGAQIRALQRAKKRRDDGSRSRWRSGRSRRLCRHRRPDRRAGVLQSAVSQP